MTDPALAALPRPVGILGGMGPAATILLQQRLLDAVPAADDGDHIPLIVDMNPQVPSRLDFLLEGRGADPGPVLAAMARRLEAAGCGALAMPCNTAHHFRDAIAGAVAIPFLDMVALSAAAAAGRIPGGTVGLLASPAVRRIGLFEAACGARGLATLWPEDEAALVAAIRAVKAGDTGDGPRAVLARAGAELSARGAGLLMIGCSEFSMIAQAAAEAGAVLDTLDCLVAAIVAQAALAAPHIAADGTR